MIVYGFVMVVLEWYVGIGLLFLVLFDVGVDKFI